MSQEKSKHISPPKNRECRYRFYQPRITRRDFLTDIVVQFVQRRKALGLTQDDVDMLMGNADRAISKWECGLRTPTSFNLLCWAEALETKIEIVPK